MNMIKSPRPSAKLKIQDWTDKDTGTVTPGIVLIARRGLSAHFTATEARSIADKFHDLSDELEATQAAKRPKVTEVPRTRPRLTAADGTEEPPLLTSPADSE